MILLTISGKYRANMLRTSSPDFKLIQQIFERRSSSLPNYNKGGIKANEEKGNIEEKELSKKYKKRIGLFRGYLIGYLRKYRL
ncbi:MAG: hypothetical protein ACTSU2_16370 [Promethearchaeota archaeon]